MRYEIQTNTLCDGWVNTWTEEKQNGESVPETFATTQDAQEALEEFLESVKEAVEYGDMEEEYDIADYRIVPVETH